MARLFSFFASFLMGFSFACWLTLLKSTQNTRELNRLSRGHQASGNKCNYGPRGPRILCTVLTHQKYFETRAKAVANTWAKNCDLTLFMTAAGKSSDRQGSSSYSGSRAFDYSNQKFVFLRLPSDTYEELTEKTIQTLVHVYENYLDSFDWLMKADDDTFVLVDNLRAFLSDKCADENTAFGRVLLFKPLKDMGYLAGGSGYALSRETVRRFGQEMERKGPSFCKSDTKFEDIDLAGCLYKIGVELGDSRDGLGRDRFHPLDFDSTWRRNNTWLQNYSKYEARTVRISNWGFLEPRTLNRVSFDHTGPGLLFGDLNQLSLRQRPGAIHHGLSR